MIREDNQAGPVLLIPRDCTNLPRRAWMTHAKVSQPTLVIMGPADPDFPDPIAEAQHIGNVFGSGPILVEGSGHYPRLTAHKQ